jgi:hypothetical protein
MIIIQKGELMLDDVQERVQNRMNGENYDETIMDEVIQTVTDRLCLRLGVMEETFPDVFKSVVVDASVKLWRRRYYEGMTAEWQASLKNEFVTDILAEYQDEIEQWLNSSAADQSGNRKVVRFL